MSGNHSDLSWDEAMGLTSGDVLSRRPRQAPPLLPRIPLGPSLWPTKHVRQVGRFRYRWWIADRNTGEEIESGHRPTDLWAWTRATRAAADEHRKRAEQRRDQS